MNKVCLDIRTWHNNDGEDSNEPYSYRGTTDGEVMSVYISEREFDYSYRSYETELEPPFVVVYATYYTGDTFGSDFDAEIVGVFKTSDEADVLVKEAEAATKFGNLSNGHYPNWLGYFESLISICTEIIYHKGRL